MKKININIYDIFVLLIILYTISTFFYQLAPSLNAILGLVFSFIVFLIYSTCLRKRDVFIIVPIVFYLLVSLLEGEKPGIFFSHTVHLVTTVLFLWKLTDRVVLKKLDNSLTKLRTFIVGAITLISVTNIVMLISGRFNSTNLGSVVFLGMSSSSHTLASISCMALIFLLNAFKNRKMTAAFIFNSISLIAIIIASGARSYLAVLLVVIYCYYNQKIRYLRYYKLITIGLIIVGVILFINSNMYERFIATYNNEYIASNRLAAMSSGRLSWWELDLRHFGSYSLINKLFGRGNEYVFQFNKSAYGLYIWAHNDFIQLLMAYGIFGFLLYIIVLGQSIRNFYTRENRAFAIIVLLTIISIAFLNGFFTQQHMVFFIVLMILLQEKPYEGADTGTRRLAPRGKSLTT